MDKHNFSTTRSTTGSRNVIVCQEKRSPFWIAQFNAPDGSRKRRSTRVPVDGGCFDGEMLSKKQAKSRALMVAFEIAKEVEQEVDQQKNVSVRELCRLMLDGKLGRVSVATCKNARADYALFCDWLGKRADAPARLVKRSDVLAWVAFRRTQVRANTCKKALTALRSAFAWAVDAELIDSNPFLNVRVQPDTRDEKVVHEAFTLGEIRLLLEKLPEEWAAAVRCCIGTYGQRLRDVITLKWDQFDWDARVVRIVTGKTRRVLSQPMMKDFYDWAFARFQAASESGGDAAVWVMPRLRLHSNPSPEFTQLVRLHGIGLRGEHAGGSRRVWHSKTFHSLRASVATMLQAAGVSQGLAMELVGHESEAVHAVYIRPSMEQLWDAAQRMPNL